MTDVPASLESVPNRYTTRSLREAEQFLCEAYNHGIRLHVDHDRNRMVFEHDSIGAAGAVGFATNRLRTTVGFDARIESLGIIAVVGLHRGTVSWTGRQYGETQITANQSCLCPIYSEYDQRIEASDFDIITLDTARVGQYAAHTCGIASKDLEFTAQSPLSDGLARHWRAAVTHVRDDVLTDPMLAAEPIVLDSAFRTLSAALLAAFPNTALEAACDPEGPGVTGRIPERTLRNVVNLIEDRAGQPFGAEDIADATDAPYRDVVEGFRRRDTDPAELLWNARLRGAYRDLHDANPTADDTVVAIAARWGFTNLARFTVAYSVIAGEKPEDTLRR